MISHQGARTVSERSGYGLVLWHIPEDSIEEQGLRGCPTLASKANSGETIGWAVPIWGITMRKMELRQRCGDPALQTFALPGLIARRIHVKLR